MFAIKIAIGFGIGIDYSLVKWPSLTSTLFKSAKIGVICGSGLLFVSLCPRALLLFALQQKAAILLLQQDRGLMLFTTRYSGICLRATARGLEKRESCQKYKAPAVSGHWPPFRAEPRQTTPIAMLLCFQ